MKTCQMCQIDVPSLSPMRKWCVDCRRKLAVIRAKEKKMKLRKLLKH
ncbi:TPA: hypothetical protein HA246_07665 [Candidatus Woesearchaeota archaeon]|nr:hypothetical protein [Candidatus Woesearchaeota archaeon]HIH43488.1 hypothetical protein [Candidatus Woesearchaeota archaeon]